MMKQPSNATQIEEKLCLGCGSTIKEKNIQRHKSVCPGSGKNRGLVVPRSIYDRETKEDEVVASSSTDVPQGAQDIIKKGKEITAVLSGEETTAVVKTDLVKSSVGTFINPPDNGVSAVKMQTTKTAEQSAQKTASGQEEETHWIEAGITSVLQYEVLQSRTGKFYVKAQCADGIERLSFSKRVVNALHGLIGELADTAFDLELETKTFQKKHTQQEIDTAQAQGKPLTVNETGEETINFVSPRRIYIGVGKNRTAYLVQQMWPSNSYAMQIAKRDTQALQAGSSTESLERTKKGTKKADKDSQPKAPAPETDKVVASSTTAPAVPATPAPAAPTTPTPIVQTVTEGGPQ